MNEGILKKCFSNNWNRFWYYYNSSWPFPSWVPQLCSLINGIQLFSILFGWLVIRNRSNNSFIQSLRSISELTVCLNFMKISNRIILLFIISLILLFLFYIGFKFKLLILNSVFVTILHFSFDVFLPIISLMAFPNLAIAIKEYFNSELDIYYIFIHLFNTIVCLTLYTVKTFSNSRMMIITTDFTQAWDNWIDYFKILYASLIPTVIVIKNSEIMYKLYYTLCIFYSILFIHSDSNQAYVHPFMNVIFITVDISLFALSIMRIKFSYLLFLSDSLHLFITLLILFLSFFFSVLYYNNKCKKCKKLIDNENDVQTFSEYLANDQISVTILRQQVIYDPQRATAFAEFLLMNSADPFIYTESIRFLVLLQCVKEDVLDKITRTNKSGYPLLYRQLIYDAQSFVVAMDVSSHSVDVFMRELHSLYSKIELLLISLSEEIQKKDKERTLEILSLYSNACQEFEGCALNAFRHSPNSPQLADLLKKYYHNLRGDYIKSHAWSHHDNVTDSSTTISFHSASSYRFPFSIYGSRILNSGQLSKTRDPTMHNKLKSQEAIEKVNSKAVFNTMIVFIVFSFVSLFVICFKFHLPNFGLCFSKGSTNNFQEMSSSLISPILNSAKFALNLIENGTTKYSNLEIPSSSSISGAVQNLTSFITFVSGLKDNSSDVFKLWSIPQKTAFSTNASVQYLMLQIKGLTKLIPHDLTNNKMRFFLMNFFHIYYSTYHPLMNLRAKIYEFVHDLSLKQYKYSLFYAFVVFLIEIVILLFFLFFMIHSANIERNKFWSIIIEVDDKSISSFQGFLKEDYISNMNQFSKSKLIDKNEDSISSKSVINEKELRSIKKKQSSSFLILLTTFFLIFLILLFLTYFYISFVIVNRSIRYNDTFDNLNIAIINVSNSATECAAILACGVESNESQNLMKLLSKNSRTLNFNRLELFDENIIEIAERINIVYEYLFSNLSKWFDNGFHNDQYFESILNSTLQMTNPYLFKIEECRYERFEYFKRLMNSTSIIFSIINFILYATFSYHFINIVVEYLNEFTFLKSLLLLLPSPYLTTISSLINLFYPENNNEDKSLNSLKLRSRYILKQSLDSIIVIDSNQKIQDVNDATELLTGLKKDELIGSEITRIINREDSEVNNASINDLLNDRESDGFFQHLSYFDDNKKGNNNNYSNVTKFNLHVIKPNGSLTPVSCTLIKIKSHDDEDLMNLSLSSNPNTNSNPNMNTNNNNNNNGNSTSNNSSNSPSSQRSSSSPQFKVSSSLSYSSLKTEDMSPAFAMVLTDRTAFTAQEEKLQETKKKVESLLYKVLPRVMASKLLSKNQKLHSKVEKATIMFIGIVNILPWSRNHNPREIMEQLDAICSMFDQNMAKFPTLVKLKLINGTYMAAAGLFNEVSDKSGPLEAVEFALLCAQSIANKNAQTHKNAPFQLTKISAVSSSTSTSSIVQPAIQIPLPPINKNTSAFINKSSSNSSAIDDSLSSSTTTAPLPPPAASSSVAVFKSKPPLPPIPNIPSNFNQNSSSSSSSSNIKLIIGINTGPIIAGILGSDKPLFDVWGDCVNVSARLETSCPCNHIQMSKETMECLPKGKFDIKIRRGVFLKGKGYTNTYTLSFEDIMNGEKVVTISETNEDEQT